MHRPSHDVRRLEVGGHGLVVFVLAGEAVPERQPRRPERAVKVGGLAEVAARRLVLAHQQVVAAHREPRHLSHTHTCSPAGSSSPPRTTTPATHTHLLYIHVVMQLYAGIPTRMRDTCMGVCRHLELTAL